MGGSDEIRVDPGHSHRAVPRTPCDDTSGMNTRPRRPVGAP